MPCIYRPTPIGLVPTRRAVTSSWFRRAMPAHESWMVQQRAAVGTRVSSDLGPRWLCSEGDRRQKDACGLPVLTDRHEHRWPAYAKADPEQPPKQIAVATGDEETRAKKHGRMADQGFQVLSLLSDRMPAKTDSGGVPGDSA